MFRRRLSCLAVLFGVLVLSTARADEAPEIISEEDVVYGQAGGEKLTLHLARPAKSDKPAPGLLIIHRGGWVAGSKDRYRGVIKDFARHGYVTVSVGYRFAPKHPFPAQIEDCKCAVRWMRAHAKDLNLDPNRIGALGESAGAYLSMMLGTLDPEDGMEGEGGWPDQSSKVNAVVSFYGPTDLRWESFATNAPPEFAEGVARRLLTAYIKASPEKNSELLHKASPVKYVDKRDAPTMLLQGTGDPLVLPSQAILMSDALTKAGVEGRTELIHGAGHDWDGEAFFGPLARARAFLDEKLRPEANSADPAAANESVPATKPVKWNPELAAKYLDDRAAFWQSWPKAQQADNTSCLACHTGFPYTLGRSALVRLKQPVSDPLKKTLANIATRVESWDANTQWYHFNDVKNEESRGTEAVLNAFVLAVKDAESPLRPFSGASKKALANLWATQRAEGDKAGSFAWLDFQLEPWESASAEYWGASLAALAVGVTPPNYQAENEVAPKIELLKGYLQRGLAETNLHNKAWLLLASLRLNGLLERDQQRAIVDELFAAQRPDGGWSTGTLGPWKLPNETTDGYATGLITYVLMQYHDADIVARAMRGAAWLAANQDPTTGAWPAVSVNTKRDPTTHVGQFMQDASTAFAVFALVNAEQ